MAIRNDSPSRRTILTGAGIGLGSGLLAQSALAARAEPAGKIWSNEYWAKKAAPGRRLALHVSQARRRAESRASAAAGSVPGARLVDLRRAPASISPSPGHGEYSVMNMFAHYGFDVWTMDHENYGRSSRTDSNSDIASGVEDLKAGDRLVVARNRPQEDSHLRRILGRLRAGAYAMAQPERVDRLVLAAFTYKGEGSPTLDRTRQATRLLPHAQPPPARPRNDPQHFHAR